MISQMGSLPSAARSALEGVRSATGKFRSAILTYFGQIVIQETVLTKGSCSPPSPLAAPPGGRWQGGEQIALELQARSHGRAATYRVSACDAKSARSAHGGGLQVSRTHEEEMPWLCLLTNVP